MEFEEFVQFIATEIQNCLTQTTVVLNYNNIEVKPHCMPNWHFAISKNELTLLYKIFNDFAKGSKKFIQEHIVSALCRDVKYAWGKLLQ